MREKYACFCVSPNSRVIRSAVGDFVCHLPGYCPAFLKIGKRFSVPKTCNAAHELEGSGENGGASRDRSGTLHE